MKIRDILQEVQQREVLLQDLACQQVKNSRDGFHDDEILKKIAKVSEEFDKYLNREVEIGD